MEDEIIGQMFKLALTETGSMWKVGHSKLGLQDDGLKKPYNHNHLQG
jgi:hypothetical protein